MNKLLFYTLEEHIGRSKDISSVYLYDIDQSRGTDIINEYYTKLMEWINKREFHQKILNTHIQLKEFIIERDDSQRVINF